LDFRRKNRQTQLYQVGCSKSRARPGLLPQRAPVFQEAAEVWRWFRRGLH